MERLIYELLRVRCGIESWWILDILAVQEFVLIPCICRHNLAHRGFGLFLLISDILFQVQDRFFYYKWTDWNTTHGKPNNESVVFGV